MGHGDDVSRTDGYDRTEAIQQTDDIGVSHHDALRLSGRAGRVDEIRRVGGH